MSEPIPRPFIKRLGGKTKLLPALLKRLPSTLEGRYIEPFVGGGALFFHLKPSNAWLNDASGELINTYEWIQQFPEVVLSNLRALAQFHSKEQYLRVRANAAELESYLAAARFIYLNKTCFNGLYRVNSKGQFNVPYGGDKPYSAIVDDANLAACSNVLQGVRLTSLDFKDVIEQAVKGDFIYADPPYIPLKATSFTKYGKNEFGLEQHRELAKCLNEAKRRGAIIVASNSNCLETMEIYKDFNIELVDNRHMVNCKGSERNLIKEVIIT
jgi:DNA adenine methylase